MTPAELSIGLAAAVRGSKTSDLLACINPDVALELLESSLGKDNVTPEAIRGWMLAIAAEIDRRIPIP